MEGLIVLAVLACPIAMGLMMLFMWKGMGSGKSQAQGQGSTEHSLPELKAEGARLAAKIDELEEAASKAEPRERV